MTKFNTGDKVITTNTKFWSNSKGIVEKIITNERISDSGAIWEENIYLIRMEETGLLMGFKANELRLISKGD